MPDAKRTPSGGPSQAAREKYGVVGEDYPIFDQQSADSALRLRGKHKPPLTKAQRRSLIRRAAKFMPEMAKAAFELDTKNGDI